MLTYQQRDKARELYTDHDYSLKELEIRFKVKMTDYIIQPWRREAKAETKRAAKQHKIVAKRKAKAARLSREEAKKMKAISNKLRVFKLDSAVINIKRCPINNWLIGG